MGKKKQIGVLTLALILISPLGAVDLDTIISDAKSQSSTIQLIELNKKKSDLSIALSEVEETVAVEVTGDVSYGNINYDFANPKTTELSIFATPSVVITLPGDEGTTITVGVDSLAKSLEKNSTSWGAVPAVNVSHTISFGDTEDTLDDLKLAKQKLELEQSYRQKIYDYENSIYTKIQEIIEYEKELAANAYDMLVQQTKMDNALKLKTTISGSATYRNMELALANLKTARSATTQKLAMAKAQFQKLTGSEWSGVESIREADLSFSAMPTGDTTVIAAAMAVEIAKEELAIEERKDMLDLMLNGGGRVNYTTISGASYAVDAGASLTGNNFSAGASVNLDIDDTGSITPTVTVSGMWKNNPTIASDVITLQSLTNEVTIAGIDYQEAMLDYQLSANQLEADILTHKLDVEQFEQTRSYDELVLEQTLDAFSKGLATQTEVDEANLHIELAEYDRRIYALKALVLENRAKTLQL